MRLASPGFQLFIEIRSTRLLIAQSLVEPLTLLTNDALLDRYRVGTRVV
jgi:hypothetical protein